MPVLTAADYVTMMVTIGWLVILEGLLSADNALVLAVMVRHLPKRQQKKALRYGIWGAFVFRLIAVLLASVLMQSWWIQVVGGFYLIYVALRHFASSSEESSGTNARFGQGFWGTVVNVELADIAFSVDSILAAVAMAESLPRHLQEVNWIKLGIVYIGGVLGIITMRFVAGGFLKLLTRFPGLATGAYFLVAWIGVKLVGEGLDHAFHPPGSHGETTGWLSQVPEAIRTLPWSMHPLMFWGVMFLIVVMSLLLGRRARGPITEHEIESLEELARIEDSPDTTAYPTDSATQAGDDHRGDDHSANGEGVTGSKGSEGDPDMSRMGV
jgi:YkoY family integral membrane protein